MISTNIAQNFHLTTANGSDDFKGLLDVLNRGDFENLPSYLDQILSSKTDILNDNKVLCFIEGNIGQGKSTLLNILKQKFDVNAIDEPCDLWMKTVDESSGLDILSKYYIELDKVSKDRDYKTDFIFAFQIIAIFSKMIAIFNRISPLEQVYFCERSIYSDRIFFETMVQSHSNAISSQNCEIYKHIHNFCSEILSPTLQMCIYMSSTELSLNDRVKDCLERVSIRARPGEESISFEYLRELDIRHMEMFIKHNFNFKILFSRLANENTASTLYHLITRTSLWENTVYRVIKTVGLAAPSQLCCHVLY